MKHLFSAAVIFSVFFIGCKKEDSQSSTSGPGSGIIINTDPAALAGRVQTNGLGVIDFNSGVTDGRLMGDSVASNQYPMELVATALPPTSGNTTLRATHVDINGNYAYVSYNMEGNDYLGGIDVFSINDASKPKLVSSVIIPFTDISAVTYFNNRLYIAGASDVNKVKNTVNPGLIGWLEYINGIPTGRFQFNYFPGEVATGITVSGNKVLATVGANGSFLSLDPLSLQQQKAITVKDLRSVTANNDHVALLSGSEGIGIYSKSDFSFIRNLSIAPDVAGAKRTMEFYDKYLLVAGGRKGVLYFDVNAGTKVGSVDLPVTLPSGIDASDVVTNAVSVNNKLFFAANGAAGTYVFNEKENHSLQLLGSIGLSGSANYVKSKDNFLFVASGKQGLSIIKFTQPASSANSCSGLPPYTGSANFNVNGNENLQYGGSVALQNVNVNAALYYCGSMTVSENLQVNGNGIMEMHGTLAVGKNRSKSLTINNKGTLKIEGDLVIYGDLRLNEGSTLQFIGDNSTITIHGNVVKDKDVNIIGTFTDVSDKL